MCGIAAIYAYDSAALSVDRDELLAIRDAMVKRGPDGHGLWLSPDGRVGLGHRRLSIIDVTDSGNQPMMSADGSIVIVFNGEIYNYRELRKQLIHRGHRFRTQSDTEVLINLYLDYGEQMLDRVRGMFAFALWDDRRKGLLLARDPLGIKPLYFADDGRTVRVASQVKALLAGGRVDTAPESAGHVGFFLWGHIPEPFTLYRGIRGLPAGGCLWFDSSGVKKIRTPHSLKLQLLEAERFPSTTSPEVQCHELREIFLDTVRHHLVADVPVGLFLSAGLDSTTLLSLAGEVNSTVLHTVTLGFQEFQNTANDETVLAEQVARQFGANHSTCWVDKADFSAGYYRFLQSMDQPTIDGVNTYFVSKAAADCGMKVALSVVGADELLAGYPSFSQIPRLVNLLSVLGISQWSGSLFRRFSAPFLKCICSPKYAGLFEFGNSYGGAYLLRRGLYMPWELPEVLDPDMVREGWQDLHTLEILQETVGDITKPQFRVAAMEFKFYLLNQLLRDSDWASMAHSLEIRTPLVDIQFISGILPLIASVDSVCAGNKQFMADLPRNRLPKAIISREKSGFSIPVSDWLMESNGATQCERGLRPWAKIVYSYQNRYARTQ